ncbi:MAG TPA: fumarate hydratase [Phycisphaerae bacterium]|nr:fumarate hydratase [Phycisphaerae bacterium]HNU45382.1 fumarate hydratase [Phycisphaerae bacterium]
MPDITEQLVELIKATSTDLAPDIEQALAAACKREEAGSAAQGALETILVNVRMSRETGRPICQDTGTPIFHVWYPQGLSQRQLREQIMQAVRIATERAYLRPNAVAALAGKNSGDNTGLDFPTIHFEEWEHDYLKVGLLLKGGGCENCGCQYSLPAPESPWSRDLKGVRKAVLNAAFKAQGLGCAPGILGVGIGGDRATSVIKAKEQLFRRLGDTNPDPQLDALEKQLLREINELGIGPMGFGGKTTVLGVQMAELHRLPASFFVSVAYMCWADRRKIMTLKDGKAVIENP